MTEPSGVVTTTSLARPLPLHEELWAFVELVAQVPVAAAASDGGAGDEGATQFLARVQNRARELLRVRCQNDNQELQPPLDGNAHGHDAAAMEQNSGAMDANERIARQALDGGLPKRDGDPARGAVDDEEEDKSDTLSDCTTITETSSVYGIHNTWVDLATLSAMPFVMQQQAADGSSSRRLQPVPPLNIAHEQSHLHKIFSESQRSLHTMRAVATVDTLRKVLDRGVTVLHFSGHGGQIAGAQHANNRNYLVFEDTQCTGLAHLVDADTLRNVLNGGGGTLVPSDELQSHESAFTSVMNRSQNADEDEPPRNGGSILRSLSSSSRGFEASRGGPSGTLKLVFVSSCHSKAIGEVFIQAGVAHVVCVRCEDQILDESSSMFSHSFYHAALTGKTVHQAFEIARVRVRAEMRIPDSEGDKFVLLESSQIHTASCPLSCNSEDVVPQAIEVNSTSSAACMCSASMSQFVFTDLATGKWVDVSPVNKFGKTLPPISESFVGREQELHLLAGLVHSQRFVTIRGPPGIGKSTLSIKLAHFVADRNVFPDGVAFVRLRGVQSLEGMESAIKSALCPDGSGGGQPSDKEMPLQHVLADLKVLLVLDNMEDPINASPSAVRDFLLQLLQATPHLSFLMTARQAMGGGIAGFDEKVVSLNRLSHFHAADLFLKQSPRPLLISEILGAAAIEPTSSGGKSRAASVLDALTEHPLMAFLDGHPQAISLCAPLLQDRSLAELTRAVLSRGVSELQVVGLPAHDRSAVNTLVTSLGVSLEQVKMHHGQDALRFFSLLGLLPAGAMAADFKSLWGPNWEPLVETLLRFSLIQRNRIPGFSSLSRSSSSNSRGLPKRSHVTGTTSSSTRRSSRSSSRTSEGFDQTLLAALKSYGDYISGGDGSHGKTDSAVDQDAANLMGARSSGNIKHGAMLNTLTRSGRASRVAEHVAQLDSQAEIMSVCVSYSTFPFITSYARSLLGMYDGADGSSDNDKNEETPLAASPNSTVLREKIAKYVVDIACFFAHALFLSGRHRGAWSAANKSLHIAKHHKDTRSEANTRKLMGILLTTETKFDEAKAQFGMALILYKAVGDKLGQAASLSAIGMIHTRKGNLRGAHNCFTKALTLYEWFKHALGQLNCHQRLANLEKKLRDGDGVARKIHQQHGGVGSSNAGYSHHYAATRRLQGDLNRKRNGEYIVRWVGHEMSLLLELPHNGAMADKLHEAQSEPSCASSSSLSGVGIAVGFASPPSRSLIKAGGSTPGVSNSPKKCRLGLIIDQKERERASATTSAAGAAGTSAPSTTAEAVQPGDKLKNSSFARRREYDAAIRKLGNTIGGGAPSLDM
uniref:NACHT domain-containing protein n=1 Tax=Globisporangium ultimum (strain ATCC 200006 / CBS 805.95 / DAOM BR144) TaxID=431595 RepID=K3X8K1_GLOUD